jgi:hypothetical protein
MHAPLLNDYSPDDATERQSFDAAEYSIAAMAGNVFRW